MEITTHSAQIKVSDREGSCGANINRRASGYVAELHFWGDQVYLARRKGDPGLRILIMPREEWKRDLESEDFEIIWKLSDIANDLSQTPTSEATACYARECVECGDILKPNYPNPICSQCERKQNNQNHDD